MDITITLKDSLLEKPKETGEYLCKIGSEWIVLHYSSVNRMFNAYDDWDFTYAARNSIKVDFWAALPE